MMIYTKAVFMLSAIIITLIMATIYMGWLLVLAPFFVFVATPLVIGAYGIYFIFNKSLATIHQPVAKMLIHAQSLVLGGDRIRIIESFDRHGSSGFNLKHSAEGSFYMTLEDSEGYELDMQRLPILSLSKSILLSPRVLSQLVKANRLKLTSALVTAGFIQRPGDDFHWSYGRLAAA